MSLLCCEQQLFCFCLLAHIVQIALSHLLMERLCLGQLICTGPCDPWSEKSLTDWMCSFVAAGIFIGITLGISSHADTARALMIALFFHQGNEGLALGVLFVKAGYSRTKYILLAAAFIIVTPVGVAIGFAVSNKYNGESKAAFGSEGVFDAVSAGIMIYNGLCDLIVPTFSDVDLPQSWTMQVTGFGALYTGAAIMALIGKWA